MKRILILLILCFAGMTIHAQDMSYYTSEFLRIDNSFRERLDILETVELLRAEGLTGVGDFYHEALKYFVQKTPDIRTIEERNAAERTARILFAGLGAEKVTAAAPELWECVKFYDVARDQNDGLAMQEALIALGKVDGKDFIPQIIQRLNNFNSQTFSGAEARRFSQRGVIGCVNALEAFREPECFRPVFFVSVGSYDPAVRDIASNALKNILDDPADIIIEIIRDSSSSPSVKLQAWREMLKTNAPNTSKARVASAALDVTFNYNTSNRTFLTNLKDMRKEAIDTIRDYGASDDSVYENLDKTYNSNFINSSPDYDEIRKALDALAAVKTDQSVGLLQKFLQDLNSRRRRGPWGRKERTLFEWVVYSIGATETKSVDVRMLLTSISRSVDYTGAEQGMATNALKSLGFN